MAEKINTYRTEEKLQFSNSSGHPFETKPNPENTLVKEILDNWREDDIAFIPTRASEAVEEKLKSLNLITVVGNSGSGKSAIIQHIALILKDQGWNVMPLDKVEEIKKICSTGVSENRILFVFNDPLGKESLDEILYHSWKSLEKTLEICLKKNKLLISCRRCVFYDKRIKGNLLDNSSAVEIDNEKNGLTIDEKRAILNQYSQNLHLSEEVFTEIIKTEAYFPLLCKLYSREANYKEKGVDFFKNPYKFIKKEIEVWKKTDKKRFCSLILIVAFKNNLKIDAIVKNDTCLMKFKEILGMCELQENTHISVIRNTLHELKGSYVKRVGNAFQFLHDFIMEITTLVFGVDCPQETIQYADTLGFLRRRVRIEDDIEEEDSDPFTVYLPEEYIGDLVDRFIFDIKTDNVIDVILNPCLRDESVIKSFKEKVESMPQTKLMEYPIFSAVCANVDSNLFKFLSPEYKKEAMDEMWYIFLPIHIASVFHNFSIIEELVRLNADVNKFTPDCSMTPLILAAANTEGHLKEIGKKIEGDRRNKTILSLLRNGAKINMCINLCNKNGASPLYIACQNGHDSTVQLLLNNGADINLCDNDGFSPLLVAGKNGHDSTVQLLLNNGADVNLSNKNGASPLYIACQNRHDSTVQLLVNNGADINLCDNDGFSPLYLACQNVHESTVQLLLNNNANINLCNKNGASPLYIACYKGHDSTVQLLLNNGADINLCDNYGASPLHIACQNGHDSTVQLLLNNGADVNLCDNYGASPLHIACQNGHDSTVQLLLNNGADINLCDNYGASPLHIACQNGHDSTVQLLLNNSATINLFNKNAVSPLYIASYNGHDSTVQLLLNNGADINLCHNDGFSPLYIACENGHDSTVLLLLNNGADINLCDNVGVSPLYKVCQNGHDSTLQLLLNNDADINLCNNYGVSPLQVACYYGHDSTVQLLLNNGADINLCDKNGASALWIACLNGHHSIVQLLLNSGADTNLFDKNGVSPLSIASENGHIKAAQLLLSNSIDPS
ncbi:ankyrin-1-like [Saccostrea cucullata]|uniref:ankyrin-1-like n=1 Tax=Saccostrea cuccullata TaxID=36930 RepID=UPI002ED5028B